jgi:hypothetical protein
VVNNKDNRFKGFPRRMQWRMLYSNDVRELKSTLGSHVATINLLLLTQTVASVTAAENQRERLACRLEEHILTHRPLLQGLNDKMEVSIEEQLGIKLHLHNHSTTLDDLEDKAAKLRDQLDDQHILLQDSQLTVAGVRVQTNSVLATTTEILSLVTLGVRNTQLIIRQLRRMFKIIKDFTTEMRMTMTELRKLFARLHTILSRIESHLPQRIDLPIIQFTDALGETMALPYQLCEHWSAFRELLGVIFLNKPGKRRVDLGKFVITNTQGRELRATSWQGSIKQGDHLSMSIILDYIVTQAKGQCGFPGCNTSLKTAELKNGGQTCPQCGRWFLSYPPLSIHWRYPEQAYLDVGKENHIQETVEDLQMYRQIYVFHDHVKGT